MSGKSAHLVCHAGVCAISQAELLPVSLQTAGRVGLELMANELSNNQSRKLKGHVFLSLFNQTLEI